MRQMHRTVPCCVIGVVFTLGCAAQDGADPGREAGAPYEQQAPVEQQPPAEQQAPAGPQAPVEEAQLDEDAQVFEEEAAFFEQASSLDPALLPASCDEHADCESDVCNRDAFFGRGACVAESRVVYVEDLGGPGCATGDGSRADPACEIRRGAELAVGGKDTVRVYSGSYFNLGAAGDTIRFFGSGADTVIVGEEDNGAAARISGGARVLLDGFTFARSVRNGINCADSTLRVVRSQAIGDLNGIVSTNCTLTLDRVRVSGSTRSGLTIAGTGRYRITNSYFSGGDIQGVVFSGSDTGTFRFNTVRGGGEISPGGIDCGTVPRVIEDSIVAGNFPAEAGAQTVGACTHRRVVVGSRDTRTLPGLIKLDPELDAEGRLLDTPANAACCIDRAARFVFGVDEDFFGTRRPQGRGNDIGAHELAVCTAEVP
jgi:hypothetical protein